MERGTYVDACCAAFPSVTPVCAATIATGARQDRHLIPSMNWYSRAERRYVEYGSSFSASRRFGIARQLTDTIYNMNAEHLSRRRRDGVRDARRRRPADGVHDVPDLPRPPRAPDLARDRAHAPGLGGHAASGDGAARAVLRRHLRHARDGLPLADGAAGHPRPARRLRRRAPRRARPVRLPAAVAARQRHPLPSPRPARAGDVDRRRRPPARAHVPRRRRRRRVPRRARRDRRGRPLACRRRAAHRARRRVRRVRAAAAQRRRPRRRRDRAVPGPALGHGLRAADRGPRGARAADRRRRRRHRGRRPRHVAPGAARGRDPRRGRRAALRARRRRPRRARRDAGRSTGRSRWSTGA